MPRGGTVQETPKRMAVIRSPPTIDSDRSRWLSPFAAGEWSRTVAHAVSESPASMTHSRVGVRSVEAEMSFGTTWSTPASLPPRNVLETC